MGRLYKKKRSCKRITSFSFESQSQRSGRPELLFYLKSSIFLSFAETVFRVIIVRGDPPTHVPIDPIFQYFFIATGGRVRTIKGVNDDISGCPRISAIVHRMWIIFVHLQLATNGEKKPFLRLLLFHPLRKGKGNHPSFSFFFFFYFHSFFL